MHRQLQICDKKQHTVSFVVACLLCADHFRIKNKNSYRKQIARQLRTQ